jgi:hypothetical protein
VARNDFLPFATGAGANVVSQTDFANDPSTSNGYSSGIAQSAKVNKTWRQSSFISAALAQFVLEELNIDVLDNGVLSDFVINLRNAMSSLQAREVLWSNTDYYVNVNTGNDSNDGSAPNQAFKTLQRASDHLLYNVDINGQYVTVHIADGTYAPFTMQTNPIGNVDANTLQFIGNIGSPGSVIISAANTSCIWFNNGCQVTVKGMTLRSPSPTDGFISGIGLVALGGAGIHMANMTFDTCGLRHIHVADNGTVWAAGAYNITGGSQQHVMCAAGGRLFWGPWFGEGAFTVTLTNNPTFSYAFAVAQTQASIGASSVSVTFSGTAVGKRYAVDTVSLIDIQGGGVNYFPGTIAGTDAPTTSGHYI